MGRMIVNLSIIILTHNRPKLFKRCLNSVINLELKNYEIIVNNDTDDIDKISRENIHYFNKKSFDISELYYFCLMNSRGKFIYFLEDDDILLEGFKTVFNKVLEYDIDLSLCNFEHCENKIKGIEFFKNEEVDFEKFIKNYKPYNLFQLSRCIFKRSVIDKFPEGNNVFNDYFLFKACKVKTLNIFRNIIYKQTTHGNDNISFKKLNKDTRFFESLNEKYRF